MDPVDIDNDVVMKDGSPSPSSASSPPQPFNKDEDHEISDDIENSTVGNKSDDDVTMSDAPASSSSSTSASSSASSDIENDNDGDNLNFQSTNTATTKQAVDVSKLLDLLDESASASNLIENKDVMLLVGLTGAGKTTTTLYLASSKFDVVDVDGEDHYRPKYELNPDLKEFATSGGAKSVTKTIHATTVYLKNEGGQKSSPVTICDTPGFGDTKGPEMEISNGLGIIHALQKSRSIKVCIVHDFSSMKGARWTPLRKNLSTVIAMMGRQNIDFSAFSYIFTRCEGKSMQKVSRQLAGFQKNLRESPPDILGSNVDDFPILDALLTDMISKTTPDKIICIDPEESEEANSQLNQLWNGPRILDPSNAFVSFCSPESMSALLLQVNSMQDQVLRHLQSGNHGAAETVVKQSIKLSDAIGMKEVSSAVDGSRNKVVASVDQLVKEIVQEAEYAGDLHTSLDDFEAKSKHILQKIEDLAKMQPLSSLCGKDIDIDNFRVEITTGLFGAARQHVDSIRTTEDLLFGRDDIKTSFTKTVSLESIYNGHADPKIIELQCRVLVKQLEDLLNPVLTSIKATFVETEPTSSSLKDGINSLLFLIEMSTFLVHEGELGCVDTTQWEWLESGWQRVILSLRMKIKCCIDHLDKIRSDMNDLLEAQDSWTPKTLLVLDNSAVYVEARSFLKEISTIASNVGISDEDLVCVDNFENSIGVYVGNVADYAKDKTTSIYDDATVEVDERVGKAKELRQVIKLISGGATTLRLCNEGDIDSLLDKLKESSTRLTTFIEESKKKRGHGIRRPKELKPTKDELERAGGRGRKALLFWYNKCVELRAYKISHGHCIVPKKWSTNPKLAKWVGLQRKEKKKYEAGLKSSLTDEKLQHLADLDFQWDFKAARNNAWEQNLQLLKEFKEQHGHCRVPKRHENKKLVLFVKNYRQDYRLMLKGQTKRGNNVINKDRVSVLKSMGLYDDIKN